MGNDKHDQSHIQISWTVVYNKRNKPLDLGLSYINKLKPATFK